MNIYLQLFLIFLKIGAVSFGGGYGMISLIREECLLNNWLTEEELLNMIAVSESTPGPIAINMATFIGSSQAGFLGSLIATLGVVLPSFIIILIIAAILKNLLKYKAVNATLSSIRPAIIGLIIGTSIIMLLKSMFNITIVQSIAFLFDWKALIILGLIFLTSISYRKLRKKTLSPIILILFSGILGIICYL